MAAQRQALILEQVQRRGGARVTDLVEGLGVSDMTVQRDLELAPDSRVTPSVVFSGHADYQCGDGVVDGVRPDRCGKVHFFATVDGASA